ncbi:hypothetical protein FNYG_04375 [Fusarium nygamai]|uniref:Uncharacterized protein n=1 Tax=Gibberella nygamai TaxID=42673 RepID=A0A2K0WIS3_GIBNY|nr:hypothetical protein FNYG_04375 [Fusarium nygamai]
MDTDNVTFDPENTYKKQPAKKVIVANAVVAKAPPGAVYATVVNGYHTSRSDKRSHCTADYYDGNRGFISRDHVV